MWTRRKSAALIAIAAIACLPAINLVAGWWQHLRQPVPGEFHLIEGRSMHLDCTGQGAPVLVLEAGLGNSWLLWQSIQPELSKVTRTCSYDRAGAGWSAPRPGSRDAETIVRELHALLAAASVPRPIVLAGASVGGFYVREYFREYPGEVAAVALLDASSPEQLTELPWGPITAADRARREAESRRDRLLVWTGWQRLAGGCHETPPRGLESLAAAFDAETCRPVWTDDSLSEWEQFEASGTQAARTQSFGDRPLLIVSQDPDRPKQGWEPKAIAAQPIWAIEQERFKSFSTRSWRVVARGSAHHVYNERPEVVVGELSRLVGYLRGGAAPPFGTTAVR